MDFQAFFEKYANELPLEMFTFLGGFIEEIIAPIPSPLIMSTAGTVAEYRDYGLFLLFILCVFGSLGKTLASWVLYILGEKAEHLVVGKWGKWFGITEESMHQLSQAINKGWKDFFILFIARAMPFFPSGVISVLGGVLEIEIKTFLAATFLGNIIRGGFFVWIGFAGKAAYDSAMGGLDSLEKAGKLLFVVAVAGIFIWLKLKPDNKKKV